MKILKCLVLLIALIAMSISVTPVTALEEWNQDDDDSSGGGSATWTVTCTYDGNEHLLSKECTSGGSASCACP